MAKPNLTLELAVWRWCCAAAVLLAGCRNLDNAQVDVLERELRQQEDYIYELEDYLIEYSEKLRQARMAQCPPTAKSGAGPPHRARLPEPTLHENAIERPTLPLNGRKKPAAPSDVPPAAEPDSVPPAAEPVPSEQPPAESPPEAVEPEEMEVPELKIGPEVSRMPPQDDELQDDDTTSVAVDSALSFDAADQPLVIPDPVDYQFDVEVATAPEGPLTPVPLEAGADAVGAPLLAAPQANESPRLVAQRLQIRHVFAESATDDQAQARFLVVVEALNATDEPVDATGEISLMIMSTDAPGSYRRINRWDFDADETSAAWQSSHLGDGLHLELPMGDQQFPDGTLELWARLVGVDGKKLLTQIPLDPQALTSMSDAAEKSLLANADQPAMPPGAIEPANGEKGVRAASAERTSAAAWRRSSVRLEDESEGFASTTSGSDGGWTSRPEGDHERRTAAAPAGSGRPSWKRSSISTDASASRPDWAPER